MKRVKTIVAVVLLTVVAAAAVAQTPSPMTARELDKFIADWPAVMTWFEARGKAIESDGLSGISAAYLASAEFTTFLKGKGWTNERFDYVAGTTFAILAYVHMEKANPDIVKELDAAIEETKKNPALDADTKAQMIKAFEEAKKGLFALPADVELREDEIRLVRAKYSALAALFELED